MKIFGNVSSLAIFISILLFSAAPIWYVSAQSNMCGLVSNPAGVCQYGTCSIGNRCELALSCSQSCISAGATSCYVCVNPIVVGLCKIANTVQPLLGLIALLLFVLGGLFYSVAHIMPSAGNFRQNVHAWALGMIVGGVAMLVIFIFAQPIIFAIGGQFGQPLYVCSTVAL